MNIIPQIQSHSQLLIANEIDLKYGFSDPMFHLWLITPDGKDVYPNNLLSNPSEMKFMVNKQRLQQAKKFAQMLDEEKVALSK